MNFKLFGAASALTLGLAICGAAAAQSANNSGDNGSADALGVNVSGLNGNSALNGNNNSNQDNNYSQINGNSVLSGNAVGSRNTHLSDSQNNNSNQHNDYSDNSGQNNSFNLALKLNLTAQDLSGEVSGVTVNGSDGTLSDGRAVTSGAITYTGGSFQNFSGIQTATTNTGLAANNLASTAVSANANVNFGGGNAGSQ
jgi:hypothetical protein